MRENGEPNAVEGESLAGKRIWSIATDARWRVRVRHSDMVGRVPTSVGDSSLERAG